MQPGINKYGFFNPEHSLFLPLTDQYNLGTYK